MIKVSAKCLHFTTSLVLYKQKLPMIASNFLNCCFCNTCLVLQYF